MAEAFSIPDSKKIVFPKLRQIKENNLHLSVIDTSFVEVVMFFDVSHLSQEEVLYLPLILSGLFEVPITYPDGRTLDYESVITNLFKDIYTFHSQIGLGSDGIGTASFPSNIQIVFKAEASKFSKIEEWAYDITQYTDFVSERLSVLSKKMLAEIPEMKRDGYKMAFLASFHLNYKKETSPSCLSLLTQKQFLTGLLKEIKKNPMDVRTKVNAIARSMMNLNQCSIHIVSNQENLRFSKIPSNVSPNKTLSASFMKLAMNECYLVKIAAIESSFSVHVAPGPSDFNDPDIIPLLVLCEYLSTLEGPFWKQIRGQGLAYSCNLGFSIDEAICYFTVYRAPDALKVFETAKEIVSSVKFDDLFLDSAKSSVVFSLVQKRASAVRSAHLEYVESVFKNRKVIDPVGDLARVRAVSVSDLERVCDKYIKNLFDPLRSNCCVTSTSAKMKEFTAGYRKSGFSVSVFNKIDDIIQLANNRNK